MPTQYCTISYPLGHETMVMRPRIMSLSIMIYSTASASSSNAAAISAFV